MELFIGMYIGVAFLTIMLHILLYIAMEDDLTLCTKSIGIILSCVMVGIAWPVYYGWQIIDYMVDNHKDKKQ